MNDTIAAISTAQGVGAISIIRVSGSSAISIVASVFSNKDFEKADLLRQQIQELGIKM